MQAPSTQPSTSTYCIKSAQRRREKGGVVFELVVDELHIYPGEFVAIVGPSGCGKSTLLDMLGLVLHPDSATEFTINVIEETGASVLDVCTMDERRLADVRKEHIGYVLQNGGLLPFLTVRDNIALTARLNHKADTWMIVEDLTQYLGIRDQLSKKPHELSGGQRQRAAIARGLAHNPAIVLADEPTAAVDKPTAIEIRDQFSHLAKRFNVSVLMVTHDESLVRPVVDRLISFELEKKSPTHTISRVIEVVFDNNGQS